MLAKISRFCLSFAAAFIVMLLFLTLRCNAYDYSKITGATAGGANISGYSGAVQVNVVDFGADPSGAKNSAKAIQEALNYARDNANSSMQVKVYVPNGTYIINGSLHIYSNTWFYMEDGAKIVRNFDSGCMMYNYHNGVGGFDGNENIVIEGGTWDGSPSVNSDDFSNLRFGHMKNLWMKNVKVINNYNGHHLELGGIKNVTIEGCEFYGYYGTKEKEAIQLDVMNSSELFAGYEPFDDTSCDNIVIRKNNFHDLVRAIGSHSGIMGVYYTNTLISDNTFTNIYGTAIIMLNHKSCTIENNTMKNVGMGLDFKYMTPIEYGSFFYPVRGINNAKFNDFANAIVRGNKITTSVSGYASQPCGLMFYGRNLTKSFLPSYNYEVDGVKITGNTIKTAGAGIVCNDVKGAFIKSNSLSFNTDGNYNSDCNLLSVLDSSEISVTSNKFAKCLNNSVYFSNTGSSSIEKNTMTEPGVSGVFLSNGCTDISIKENTVNKASSNGIKAIKGSKAALISNTVSKSSGNGVVADNSAIKLVSNKLSSNGEYAMYASNSGAIQTDSDEMSENSKGAYGYDDSSTVRLTAPKGLISSDVYSTNLLLTWNEVANADGYNIYRKENTDEANFELIGSTEFTTFKDTKTSPNTSYLYTVCAYYNNGTDGYYADNISVKTKNSLALCSANILPEMLYTGKEITQYFDVYCGAKLLVKDVDYAVSYENNIAVGTAEVTVSGIGAYCDRAKFDFQIKFSLDSEAVGIAPQKIDTANTTIMTAAVKNPMRAKGYEVVSLIQSQFSANCQTDDGDNDFVCTDKFATSPVTVRSYRLINGKKVYGAWL